MDCPPTGAVEPHPPAVIVHWHRRDLRATDNHALSQAAKTDSVVPVFIVDPSLLSCAAPPRVTFMLESLSRLREWYRDRGSDLVVERGDPATQLPRIAQEIGAHRVVWNEDHSGIARNRDEAVRAALNDEGIEAASFADALLHPPGSITTQAGNAYSVFSYFWDKWRDRDPQSPHPTPAASRLRGASETAIPTRRDLGFEAPESDVSPGGIEAAAERLEAFVDGPIYQYAERRDVPAADVTSRLSPHLKWGTIGIRTVIEAVERAMVAAPDERAAESCEAFTRQLAWRDFYGHGLAATPEMVSSDYRPFERPIRWREDVDGLRAWKAGMTGFPIVDAGMRQLRAEAFMHNRVRMIVASFLTKDLLIDWREGYAWFREMLVDHDAANDAGGWQWAAGTGMDAQPYYRVFNPTRQGERFDPEAAYIRAYVAELEEVPPTQIHAWTELDPDERSAVAPAYPAPIVDHGTRREQAIAMFEDARGNG